MGWRALSTSRAWRDTDRAPFSPPLADAQKEAYPVYRLRGGGGGGSIHRLKVALFAGWRQQTLQHLDCLSRRRQPEKLPSQAKMLFYRACCWSLTAIPYRCIKPSFTISQLTRRSNHFFSFTTPQHPIAPMIITSAPAAMRMLAAVLNPPSSIRAE